MSLCKTLKQTTESLIIINVNNTLKWFDNLKQSVNFNFYSLLASQITECFIQENNTTISY